MPDIKVVLPRGQSLVVEFGESDLSFTHVFGEDECSVHSPEGVIYEEKLNAQGEQSFLRMDIEEDGPLSLWHVDSLLIDSNGCPTFLVSFKGSHMGSPAVGTRVMWNDPRARPITGQFLRAFGSVWSFLHGAGGTIGQFCGLNADWNCQAFHCGPGGFSETNRRTGEVYVLDGEDLTEGRDAFVVVRAHNDGDPRGYCPDMQAYTSSEVYSGSSLGDAMASALAAVKIADIDRLAFGLVMADINDPENFDGSMNANDALEVMAGGELPAQRPSVA